jgi:hypothetical protein
MATIAPTCISRDRRIAVDTPKRSGIDRRPWTAIELDVLTGIQDVEAADPQADRETEEPRLDAAAAAGRKPATNRCDRQRQAKKQLRVRCHALGERIPEDDDQRHRRQGQTHWAESRGREDEHDR